MVFIISCGSDGDGGHHDGNNTEPATYSITGQIVSNNTGLAGVTVSLSGASTAQTTTDANGNYSFTGLADGIYTVTLSKTDHTFSPSNIDVTVNGENENNINFTSVTSETRAYTVSGTVSGAVVSGITITLTGTSSKSTTTDASGNYSFTGAVNGSYTITPSVAGYTYSPASRTVTVNNTNITGQNFTVVVITSGSLDTTFGKSGKVTTAIGIIHDYAYALGIQPDGKIVAAGSSHNGYNDDFALVRYNVDGSLDTTFGTGGKVTTAIGSSGDVAYALGIQSDGRIVVAGISWNGSHTDSALVRYNANGSLDTTFGIGGKVITPVGSRHDYARALGIQSDGEIVTAGYYLNQDGYNNFVLVRYWP